MSTLPGPQKFMCRNCCETVLPNVGAILLRAAGSAASMHLLPRTARTLRSLAELRDGRRGKAAGKLARHEDDLTKWMCVMVLLPHDKAVAIDEKEWVVVTRITDPFNNIDTIATKDPETPELVLDEQADPSATLRTCPAATIVLARADKSLEEASAKQATRARVEATPRECRATGRRRRSSAARARETRMRARLVEGVHVEAWGRRQAGRRLDARR